MRGILADNDAEGYVGIIHGNWLSNAWRDIWDGLGLSVVSFAALHIPRESSDALVWRKCQSENLVLVTGNRNADEPDSLEMVIRNENQSDYLPVATLANPQRIIRDRRYAEIVAEKLLEHLFAIDDVRGAGRIYVP